jgi:hypothetical protein
MAEISAAGTVNPPSAAAVFSSPGIPDNST